MKLFYIFIINLVILNSYIATSQVILDTIAVEQSLNHIVKPIEARYYFYPNLDAYFDMKSAQFIFKEKGIWIKNETIASNYRGYSIYNNYNIPILDYHGEKPYENLKVHQKENPQDYKGKFKKIPIKNLNKIITMN